MKRIFKRQRHVSEQGYAVVNAAAIFPIVHYSAQKEAPSAAGMDIDD